MTSLTRLLREYRQFEAKPENKGKFDNDVPPLLNFIPSSHLAKIKWPTAGDGEVWSRKHDCELLVNIYENGCEKLEITKQHRIAKLI